ncbi:MAG: Lrp/AsnC family transcriptional regulator [Bosea sp. (in: a-proteobacteria)]
MSHRIDATDKRILTELQRDSTLSLDALGEIVALSRNACWRRIQQMEAAGIIKGRVTLLDPAALNLALNVFIVVRTGRHSAEWAEAFRAALRDIPEITGAYRTAGDIDYILRARVPDVAAYDRLYQRLISRVDMTDVSASFVMEEMKETHELPLSYMG